MRGSSWQAIATAAAKIGFCGWLVLAGPALSVVWAADIEAMQKVLHQFDGARAQLAAALRSPPVAATASIPLGGRATSGLWACDYLGACDILSLNRDRAYVYVNAQGEKIPNYALFAADQELQSCYAKQIQELDQSNQSFDKVEAQEQAYVRKVEEAHQKFFSALKNHWGRHDSDAYVALSRAANQVAYQGRDNKATPIGAEALFDFGQSREKVDHGLSELENKAGKKLSPPARAALIDYLVLKAGGFDSGPNAPKMAALNTNPFLDFKLLGDKDQAGGKIQLDENRRRFVGELNRVYKIFGKVQAQIVELLRSRAGWEHRPETDNLIARVRTIRFVPVLDHPNCSSPNAFYDPDSHSFSVCPQLMEAPEATLQFVIAHEVAHSIDPCLATGELKSVVGMEAYRKKVEGASSFPSPDEFNPKIEQEANKPYYFDDVVGVPNKLIRDLESESVFFKTELPGVGMSHHPFFSVIQCIEQPRSISARGGSLDTISTTMTVAAQSFEETGATSANNATYRSIKQGLADLPAFMLDHGACAFVPGQKAKTQLQEAFADWVAGEVIGRELEAEATQHLASEEDIRRRAIESFLFLPALSCSSLEEGLYQQIQLSIQKAGCGDSDAGSPLMQTVRAIGLSDRIVNGDPHPWFTRRINRLLMANPAMKQAASCHEFVEPVLPGHRPEPMAEHCE